VDGKIINREMIEERKILVNFSMTHDKVPVFKWSDLETKKGENFIRNGLPDS